MRKTTLQKVRNKNPISELGVILSAGVLLPGLIKGRDCLFAGAFHGTFNIVQNRSDFRATAQQKGRKKGKNYQQMNS
jgi:hypothetical protein